MKIVYYGPALSGKTANLHYIYSHIDPALRGDLVKLETRENKTVFFDFLQLGVGNVEGKKTKFNLYTVPGHADYNLTRKSVLNNVDGIVFVADSQQEMMNANLDILLDLEKHLICDGKTLENFPWVLQYNKRDMLSAELIDEMEHKLNFFNVSSFEAVATRGEGVFATLKEVTKKVISNVQSHLEIDKRMRA